MPMKALIGFLTLALMLVVAASAQQPAPAKAPARPQVVAAIAQTKETQAAITPQMALQMLKDGNERFVSGTMKKRDLTKQVKATSTGQFPFATVVSCMDSRAAPELIFDQGIGDVFSPRVAGNFVNDDIIGSLEYGSGAAGARLIVVLGHSDCGAIKGACDNVKFGDLLLATLASIKPAIDAVPDDGSPRNSKNYAFVQRVADMNVAMAVKRIRDKSSLLRGMADKSEIKIVGAMLDVKTGTVTFVE
jgi:carbonic anhydrase